MNEFEVEAKQDLFGFLREAKPSVESLRKLQASIRAGEIDPKLYWDKHEQCGCLKGTLFLHETGMDPYTARNNLIRESGDVELLVKILEYEYGRIEGTISYQFNWAEVGQQTPIEGWMLGYYDTSTDDVPNMVAGWIDEFIQEELGTQT